MFWVDDDLIRCGWQGIRGIFFAKWFDVILIRIDEGFCSRMGPGWRGSYPQQTIELRKLIVLVLVDPLNS